MKAIRSLADNYSFFEEEDFQGFDFDIELNQLLDKTDFDETDDFFWDEN